MLDDKVNILLVDDQPAKLLAYEVMLHDVGENLLKANSAREALETLLKVEVAVVLMDVSMPELDGFELAAMVRDHPRFHRTAIIFVSAIHLSEVDFLRGYQMGAVDYVSVPVIPEVLRAKVKVFAELYRKTRELQLLNVGLEARVKERTAALEETAQRLLQSEQSRSLALAAGQMGSWDWDLTTGEVQWDEGQYRILGVEPSNFPINIANLQKIIDPDDWDELEELVRGLSPQSQACQAEFRVRRPDGDMRWCFGTAAATINGDGHMVRISGVILDVTERKLAEEQQALLTREVDHRAKNMLAVVQSIVRLSRTDNVDKYIKAIEGRIQALSRVHNLISMSRWEGAELGRLIEDELEPYRLAGPCSLQTDGPPLLLNPSTAQTLALALHELATNAAKYGALSVPGGSIHLVWREEGGALKLNWTETGGPPTTEPSAPGFGLNVIVRTLGDYVGGNVDFDWRREGLRCALSVPLSGVASRKRETPMSAKAKIDLPSAPYRILLVEDEALVGLMMADLLTGMGYAVVGPLATVGEAMAPAADASIDAALLDVTLGSERIYPVAEILAARGVPFAFLTGYSRDGIDPKFAASPVLQKPVDEAALTGFLQRLKRQRVPEPGQPLGKFSAASNGSIWGTA